MVMVRSLIFVLGGSIFLAACGNDSSGDGARGVHEKEIVIGTHQDLSGPLVSWGAPVRNGMQMAVDEINAAGGVNGRKLRLIVEDNGYDPRRATLAVRKLVLRDGVFAVVGALGSPTTLASMPFVLEKNVLHLFPFTAAEGTYHPHHNLKFASNVPYKDAIRVGVRYFVQGLGYRKAGILYQDDDFGLDVRRGAEAELERLGLEPVSITSYKRGATDFSAQIARMRADGADFLIMGTIIRETVGAIRAANALGWQVPVLCSQACYTPEVHDLGGELVEGVYAVGQLPIPYPDDPDPKIRDWLKHYQAQFGVKPNVQAISGYLITNLFAAGLEAAGDTPTQETFAKALENLPPWTDPRVGGAPIDYTAEDHLGINRVFIARIENGRWQQNTDYVAVEVE